MQTNYSGARPGWNPAGRRIDEAAYYAERAAVERQHAISAANEVVAIVHRNLACRYAAIAAERAKAGR